MNGSSVARVVIVPLFLIAVSLPLTVTSSSQTEDKPVETVAKNIQVLKGMPASQLLPVMNLMASSLGVRCDYCHIAENGKFQLDDKRPKQTARKMIQMTFDINKSNFNGETEVTCNSCHRGSTRPVGTPQISQAFSATPANTTATAAPAPNPAEKRPTVDEIFSKYFTAIGGEEAVRKVQTRVSDVSLERPKLVNPSGKPTTVQIFQKAPDKLLIAITGPDGGVTYQGFNGTTGWFKTPTQQREMSSSEVAQMKQQAALINQLTLKDQLTNARVAGKRKVNDRDAYVLVGTNANKTREQLFFDVETGLLVRRVQLNQTVLGVDPMQTDFSDYRVVDGVKLPFTIEISSLDNAHQGQKRTFTQIKQNVPVEDTKFEPPK